MATIDHTSPVCLVDRNGPQLTHAVGARYRRSMGRRRYGESVDPYEVAIMAIERILGEHEEYFRHFQSSPDQCWGRGLLPLDGLVLYGLNTALYFLRQRRAARSRSSR